MIKLAVDPGRHGALAVEIDGKVYTHNCPETQAEMHELLFEYKQLSQLEVNPIVAVIEKVHSMPGQGVKSVWTFASNYASWQMGLVCNKIPFTEVRPLAWQKQLGGCPKDKAERKRYIKDYMQKKYPELKVTLKNADALALLGYE